MGDDHQIAKFAVAERIARKRGRASVLARATRLTLAAISNHMTSTSSFA